MKVPAACRVERFPHDHLDVELRLEVDPHAAEGLARSALLGLAEVEAERLDATYFDTPENDLAAAGFSLHVWRSGQRRVQTLETKGRSDAGLFVRSSWESEVPGDSPLPDSLAPLPAGSMPDDGQARLRPAFHVHLARAAGQVERDGALIEVAVDRGELTDGGHGVRIDEVELVLRHGPPSALFDLAREIDAIAPVRVDVLTRSERGFRLIDHTAGMATKAEPVALDPGTSAASAFQRIASACLRQFRLNETLLADRHATEILHQTRVALRRLRTALIVFRPIFDGDAGYRHVRAELRWLAAELGPARNLDVLLPRLEDGGLAALVENARADAYARAEAGLASFRARRLMLDLAEWIAIGPWVTRPADPSRLDRSVVALAGASLDRAVRRVAKAGRAARDDRNVHPLRIEIKRLRYAAEFFGSLYAGRRAAARHAALVATAERLQTILGEITDRHAARATLAALGVTGDPAGFAADDGDRHALKKARRAVSKLVDRRPFWR